MPKPQKQKSPQKTEYLGTVDALGAVHATALTEQEITRTIHRRNDQVRWRYRSKSNTLEFWIEPPVETKELLLTWLARKGLHPKIKVLLPFAP